MAGHGERIQSPVSRNLNYPGFVLPISDHLSGWRRFLSSLSPFVARSSDRTPSVYARRLIIENDIPPDSQSISSPALGERHRRSNLLDWSLLFSSSNVHLERRMNLSNIDENQENFISVPLQENENVVISIEADPSRESHRRPSTPMASRANDDVLQALPSHSETIAFDSGAPPFTSGSENVNAESLQQAERGPGLSINGESVTDILETHPELRNVLKLAWQYFVFILIIMVKIIYDRFTSLLIVLLFFIGFVLSNKVVKLSVSHQERRSKKLTLSLLVVLVSIPLSVFIFYHMASTNIYYSAMLLPSDNSFLSLGEVLWIVMVTDFVLKLSSIFIKGLYSLLPNVLLHYKNRGKHLAMIEITSQLYRSLAPVQPWISYLLDSYTGIQKIFGIFLSVLYMLCKGPDIIHRVKMFHLVLRKFRQSSTYGSTPSKLQLKDTGSLCPICQDDFVVPTMLQCKHIFCEQCVAKWFDRERTCPMCRTSVTDDPSYRDGATSFSVQLY